jgi:hypothetical protein
MKKFVCFVGVGVAAVLFGASCHKSPEDFCQSWVQSTCQAIAGCCPGGLSFDPEECQISLSGTCQKDLDVDQVQSGERKFDSGAASDCFGSINSCPDFQNTLTNAGTYAHEKACANMVTGFRAVGTACSSPTDCQKDGDFTACYDGTMGAGNGICVKVVLDTATCSFSFSTNELHVCPDGTFCDTSGLMPNPTDPPSMRQFEFSAPCTPFLAAGAPCGGIGPNQQAQCGEGLYCAFPQGMPPNMATCQPRANQGDSCSGGVQCAVGLQCMVPVGGMGPTCQPTGSFCFTP